MAFVTSSRASASPTIFPNHRHRHYVFASQYPAKPPSIEFLTPNGRFATGTALCLKGATAHHAEDWDARITITALIASLR